jgi:hypothetical protein
MIKPVLCDLKSSQLNIQILSYGISFPSGPTLISVFFPAF